MIKIFLLQGAVEIIDERSGSSGFSLNCHGPHRHALHQEVSMEKSAPVFRRKTEPFIPAHDTNIDVRNPHTQRIVIASAAVLTAKSNNQIKKPIKPLLKIT